MLLIDDEADNASINIAHGKGEISRINGQIRALLKIFERSCYVGYTATPFANIFIDPDSDDEMRGDDLFPRSFIVSLDPPSNYFGAGKVFLKNADAIIRHIDDNEDLLPITHPIGLKIAALPPSLIRAIRTFVVARAIRLSRGHERKHCSMLVNASRFTGVQGQIRNEVHIQLEKIQASVRVNGALPSNQAIQDAEIAALRDVWFDEFSNTGITWAEVQKNLIKAAAPIKVVEVNSGSAGTLNYAEYEESGLNVIAVGGFSLSRGLTLEGLMVSYFLRNSMMYDTLMQMGRWFGYRPDYDDLCRIWMPEDAEGWYAHITESIEMLREELRSMEAADATPEEFGLKVRSHPDTLIVTARNKMGTGERVVVNIGLGKNFIETAILRHDEASLESNRQAVQNLAQNLAEMNFPVSGAEQVSAGWLLRGAPVEAVLKFIAEFKNHQGSMLTDPGPVGRYIDERRGDELAKWDILFTSVSRAESDTLVDDKLLGLKIKCQMRTASNKSDINTLRVTKKQRVASRGVEKVGLSEAEIETAERAYTESKKLVGEDVTGLNYPDRIYRAERKCPLLLVHLLKIEYEDGVVQQRPVVAWSISFPKTEKEENRVEFIVGTVWMRENYRDDVDASEMEGDND